MEQKPERLFVAAPLTDQAREEIAAHVRASLPGGVPGRMPPAANWHLTLRFLGACTRAQRDGMRDALAASALGGAFHVVFGGLGAFPNPRRARVLWIGIDEGADRLRELAAIAEGAARARGFEPEAKRFTPHLTLSRIQPPHPVAAEIHAVPPLGLRMPVREIVIYRSHLGAGPARYEAVERFPLSS